MPSASANVTTSVAMGVRAPRKVEKLLRILSRQVGAHRGENDGGIELDARSLLRAAGPHTSELGGKALVAFSPARVKA